MQDSNNTGMARRALLALGGLAVFAGASARASTSALPADLAQALDAYDRATTSNDTAALDALIAEDYMLVNSDSSVEDKAQYLADFHLPGFRIDPYVMQEPLQKVWGEFALTGGLLPLTWTQDGAPHRRTLRIVHAWIKREGRWRIAYTQLTHVPD